MPSGKISNKKYIPKYYKQENLTGDVNIPVKNIINYEGLETDTTTTIVDNHDRTIEVNIKDNFIDNINEQLDNLNQMLSKKQDKLIAGNNITIENNVISATSELEFKNRYEFPTIGKKNILYIATDEHTIYIWDDINRKFIVAKQDIKENSLNITLINGGNA